VDVPATGQPSRLPEGLKFQEGRIGYLTTEADPSPHVLMESGDFPLCFQVTSSQEGAAPKIACKSFTLRVSEPAPDEFSKILICDIEDPITGNYEAVGVPCHTLPAVNMNEETVWIITAGGGSDGAESGDACGWTKGTGRRRCNCRSCVSVF